MALNVLWSNGLEEFDVLFRMESAHILVGCFVGLADSHFLGEAVFMYEFVSDCQSVGFHWMSEACEKPQNYCLL